MLRPGVAVSLRILRRVANRLSRIREHDALARDARGDKGVDQRFIVHVVVDHNAVIHYTRYEVRISKIPPAYRADRHHRQDLPVIAPRQVAVAVKVCPGLSAPNGFECLAQGSHCTTSAIIVHPSFCSARTTAS